MLNKLVIKPHSYYCGLEVFNINDVENSNWYDFGYTYDSNPSNAPDYGCGDRRFHADPPTQQVLDKYSITEKEYEEICDELKDALHFGNCAWCS